MRLLRRPAARKDEIRKIRLSHRSDMEGFEYLVLIAVAAVLFLLTVIAE